MLIKAKLFLFFIKQNVIKTYGGVDEYLHTFLTSALDGSEWSASCPGRFILVEKAPGTH
jgi:hypothetical protein